MTIFLEGNFVTTILTVEEDWEIVIWNELVE